jgi:hypothetical protein
VVQQGSEGSLDMLKHQLVQSTFAIRFRRTIERSAPRPFL